MTRACLRAACLVLVVVACGPLERPPNTPMARTGIFERIALEGGTIESVTSGDPGCADPGLAGNAVRLRVRSPDGAAADVHLLTFRNRPFWEASATAANACVGELATAHHVDAAGVERLDISPYRAWGVDLSPGLMDVLERALTVAAGDGGIPRGRDGRPLPTATTTN